MIRREFLASTSAAAAASAIPTWAQGQTDINSFPENVLRDNPYVEHDPIEGCHNAPASAYEAFQDMKFGARIHWASIPSGTAELNPGPS
jgi:hypothetical protein